MASFVMVAVANEKYPVYDGTRLFKKGWVQKSRAKKKDAALLAGVTEDKLGKEDETHILKRMDEVKKAFAAWMNTHITTWWLDNAKNIGLKNHKTKKAVTTFPELLAELESNPRMESFLNWYNICYKDTDIKMNVRNGPEQDVMRVLKLKYHDDTTAGGCVGDLILEVQRKLMEQLNNRSRAKQSLHLVKSRPTFDDKNRKSKNERRNLGDFYIVKSDKDGKAESWTVFNVSVHTMVVQLFGDLLTNYYFVILYIKLRRTKLNRKC
jgi:hypothetical protein